MALNFFDQDQLARGADVGSERRDDNENSNGQGKKSKKENKLRMKVPTLRKLRSETAIRAHNKGLNSPLSPSSPDSPVAKRPATSRTAKEQIAASLAAGYGQRPASSHSARSDISTDSQPSHPFLSRKTRSRSKERRPTTASADERPMTSGLEVAEGHEAQKEKTKKEGYVPSRKRSRSLRKKSSQILRNLTSRNTDVPPVPSKPPPPAVMPELSERQAQYLAEALAHVTVGEWLYKDPRSPSLIPRTNFFRRQTAPPPRGSTGLPQKRWFRISPYDRKVMWSSKWDASSSAQYKTSRQVPVDLVFEAPANPLLESCLPHHLQPFTRSIVILTRQRIVKVTAPDEERHRFWLTALRYISESVVKLDDANWAKDLRARFDVLATDLSIPSETMLQQQLALAYRDFEPGKDHLSMGFFTEKPLPPSPPRSMMTPPAVPRIPSNILEASGALSLRHDSDSMLREAREPEQFWRPPQTATTHRSAHEIYSQDEKGAASEVESSRTSRHLDSEEVDMGQMESLVDKLVAI